MIYISLTYEHEFQENFKRQAPIMIEFPLDRFDNDR